MPLNEGMYPYTAKEARERGELELWRANFRANCACAGAIELSIRRDFDGMHLKDGCAKSVIDQYGYKRVGFVLANTLQEHAYDGRYHEVNKQWSRRIFIPSDGGHRLTFLVNSHPAVLDGFVSDYRGELARLHLFGAEHCLPDTGSRISPARCWYCRRTHCGRTAGSRRTSSGWPIAALAVCPTPVGGRCSAPASWMAKQPAGIAVSS